MESYPLSCKCYPSSTAILWVSDYLSELTLGGSSALAYGECIRVDGCVGVGDTVYFSAHMELVAGGGVESSPIIEQLSGGRDGCKSLVLLGHFES